MTTLLPRRALAACAIATALLAGADADAQPLTPDAPIVGADQNAALRYWRAYSLMDDDLNRLVGEVSESLSAPSFNPTPELRKAVGESEGVIEQLIRGSALPACDFGVDRELGIEALLPHLQPMRYFGRLLLIDARLRLEAGDEAGAAERIGASFRMAEHAAQDGFVISSLVGVAMWNQSRLVTERSLDSGALGAESRAVIRRALDAYPAGDPFHAVAAQRAESEMILGWLRATIRETGGGEGLRAALGGQDTGFDFTALDALDETALQSHVDLMRAAYDQVVAAWGSPDPQGALNKVNEEVRAGAFGELARLLLPSLGRYHQSVQKAQADFAAFKELLAE